MKKSYALLGSALLLTATAASGLSDSALRTHRIAKQANPEKLPLTEAASATLRKASAETISSLNTDSPRKEAASDEWTSIGTGTYTDAILSDFFTTVEPTTFDVEIEQNVADPDTYRIVNPYANWTNPYSNVTYHDEMTNYLVFHIYDGRYAWIEDFNTGVEFVDEETPLGDEGDYFLKALSNTAALVDYNGIDLVASVLPSALATYENGVIRQPATYTNGGRTYYSLLLEWADCSDSYYIANSGGDFMITMPGATVPQTEWVSLGTGKYTDDILASLFSDIDVETMEVEIMQDADDPTHFCIPNPYAAHSATLTNNGNGMLEFYVIDETYAYFTKMNTGIVFGSTELNAKMNVSSMISTYGHSMVYSVYPDAFLQYDNGIITASTYFVDGEDEYPVLLIPYGGNNYIANKSGMLCIEFPSAAEEDPYNWEPLGTGRFTDDFLASFIPDAEISTFDVEVERDTDNPDHYRLVDPYANWQHDTYSASAPGVAEFYIVNDAYAYFPKFVTGVRYEGKILEVSHNVMGPLNNGMTIDDVIAIFPESLAKYEDGVLTATATFDNGGTPFSVFQIPYNNALERVNLSEAFRLEMPTDTPNSVSEIETESEFPAVYYNLQGARVDNPAAGIYIRVCGDRADKVIVR
ncbi:MAG: hypothetical protein K2L59_08000 [Muribaculaceae bacterium]|nr:hypothetical protein [Muribaculaceae bacterium]